jgi:peptidoglycan/LPS O-acetylase OafA/YrhL
MRETMREHLRRRYRLALAGVVIGAVLMISAPGSALTIALEMAGAVVLGSALLIAVRTRCPKCSRLFDSHVIAALVRYSQAPPERCPHCGVDLNQSQE